MFINAHDLALATRFCSEVLLMAGGRLIENGPPEDVLTDQRLADVYQVEGYHGEADGQGFVLPWRRLLNEQTG